MAETQMAHRSKSPMTPLLSKNKLFENTLSTNTIETSREQIKKRNSNSITRLREKEKTPQNNMVSFEIANFTIEDYLNEKIVFVKFLDDNDPRLLFLVTYHAKLDTTYMKVAKIEKSGRYYERKITESGGVVRQVSVVKTHHNCIIKPIK
jgi:hypothetical protein